MSEKLGLVKLGHKHQEVFLGRDIGEERNYSDEIAYEIDKEIKKIMDECYYKVRNILVDNISKMDLVAEALLEREIIEGKELDDLLQLNGGRRTESDAGDSIEKRRTEETKEASLT